jgi:hypothetical protein
LILFESFALLGTNSPRPPLRATNISGVQVVAAFGQSCSWSLILPSRHSSALIPKVLDMLTTKDVYISPQDITSSRGVVLDGFIRLLRPRRSSTEDSSSGCVMTRELKLAGL